MGLLTRPAAPLTLVSVRPESAFWVCRLYSRGRKHCHRPIPSSSTDTDSDYSCTCSHSSKSISDSSGGRSAAAVLRARRTNDDSFQTARSILLAAK